MLMLGIDYKEIPMGMQICPKCGMLYPMLNESSSHFCNGGDDTVANKDKKPAKAKKPKKKVKKTKKEQY